MKNLFFPAIALITFGVAATEADAQYYIVKDGKVIEHSDADGDLLDYISFEKPSFTVTFDSGEGATTINEQVVKYNEYANKPVDPVLAGYEFKGWYDGEELFDFSAPINGDVKLTAKWKEVSAVAIPDAVDLGLSVKWASFNIGATAPEEYGDYFAWGETEPHYADGHSQDSPCNDWRDGYSGYNWNNYKFTKDGVSSFTKYTNDSTTKLEDADDVATKLLGNDWQMPTYEQQLELYNNCYWVWTSTYKGKPVNGYIVYKAKDDADKGVKVYKNRTASNEYNVASDTHIFLPAAGYRDDAYLKNAGSNGYYWSRSLFTDYSPYITYGSNYACYLLFSSSRVYPDHFGRNFGLSVRAVQRKN